MDLPTVGLLKAGEDLHERRLPLAVSADEADPLARLEAQTSILEKRPKTEVDAQPVCANQGHRGSSGAVALAHVSRSGRGASTGR
jgi:hypothetical protein